MNMHKGEEKLIDDLLREKIRQVTPEVPGTGFVPSVMFSIEQLALTKQSRKAEPLISRKGWLVVVLIIVGLSILFSLTGTGKFNLAPLTDLINRFNISFIPMFFSNFFLIALVTFVMFFLVQIYLISGYLERAHRVEQ
jgi:ABC-type uncharacterized transport system fused permease/ATPase subunit